MSSIRKNRKKLFIENMLIYGLGSSFNKIIPLIMLPILTSIYPDTSYIGSNDSVSLLVSFVSQIAILGVYDAMYRYYFEKDDVIFKRRVTSTALFMLLVSGGLMLMIVNLLNKPITRLIFVGTQYNDLVTLSSFISFFTMVNLILSAPTRMQNKRIVYILIHLITSLISYSVALLLVLNDEYLLAVPIGNLLSTISSTIIFFILNYKHFSIKLYDLSLSKKLLKLGIPIMPSLVFYWVLNSAQKVIITNQIGMEQTGIYTVGAKLSSVSQLIYTAFSSGWQYFIFSTMKDSDHTKVISKVFEYLAAISFASSALLIFIVKPVFVMLFNESYYEGVWVTPALFLAPLIQMLYQTISNQFLVVKKTGFGALCLAAGAFISICIDYLLIPKIGIRGAAIAVLLGFTFATVLVGLVLNRMKLFIFNVRTLILAVFLFSAIISFTLKSDERVYFTLSILTLLTSLVLYRQDIITILRSIKSTKKGAI